MEQNLFRLPIRQSASVTALTTPDPLRRRLLDLGFTPGARVVCLYAAPGGDPRAYLVRDTVIALRNADARTVLTEASHAE